ncbi:hypothetical protein RRF57_004342 [Xylaria bambusicola]|uniref:Uncharacterized protein n=1 Tax=Xylaria bambusicola TaxID=326684 RepID=A0AAN7Z4B2_9PEZI
MDDIALLELHWSSVCVTIPSQLNDRLRITRYWTPRGVNFELLMSDAKSVAEGLKGFDMPKSGQQKPDNVSQPPSRMLASSISEKGIDVSERAVLAKLRAKIHMLQLRSSIDWMVVPGNTRSVPRTSILAY